MQTKVRIVCISDTHNAAPGEGYTLPEGDVLIHAGDLTNQGSRSEMNKVVKWLSEGKYEVKIVIGGWLQSSLVDETQLLTTTGNHDISLDPEYVLKHKAGWSVTHENAAELRELLASEPSVIYLKHERKDVVIPSKGVTLRVFGSPWSPEDPNKRQNWAFQYDEDDAEAYWSAVPSEVDILITHAPPRGHCDSSRHWQGGGCPALARTISRVRPLLHVCGHCHEGRGVEIVEWGDSSESLPDATSSTATTSAMVTTSCVPTWEDPGKNSKRQSLLDLTGRSGFALQAGEMTAVVNASIMAKSFGHGTKEYNKPIVVDLLLDGTGT
jgi:Icc-related predicted phosphoesterase